MSWKRDGQQEKMLTDGKGSWQHTGLWGSALKAEAQQRGLCLKPEWHKMQEGSRTSTLGHTACQRSGRITKLHSRHVSYFSHTFGSTVSVLWVGMCWLLAVPAVAALGLALLTDPIGGEDIFVLLLTCGEDTAEEQPMENNFVLWGG